MEKNIRDDSNADRKMESQNGRKVYPQDGSSL